MIKSAFTEALEKSRDLLKEDSTEAAIDLLEGFVHDLGYQDLLSEIIHLHGQLTRLRREIRLKQINEEMASIDLNKINNAILEIIKIIEKKGPPAKSGKKGWGRLMHNIPQKMLVQKRTKCTVRVAKDDDILLENFLKTEDTLIKTIPLTKFMEVELEDASDEPAFRIEPKTRMIRQYIDDFYTEWVFYATPLRAGSHELNIKVTNVGIFEGEEVKRELAYCSTVTVVTLETEASAEELASTFKDTDILSPPGAGAQGKGGLGFLAALFSKPALVPLFIISLSLVGVAAYWFWKNPPKPPAKPRIDVALIIDKDARPPFTVYLDSAIVSGWTYDSAKILLPSLEESAYLATVKAANGSCQDSIYPSLQQNRFELSCLLVPDTFTIKIITPFANPKIYVDRQQFVNVETSNAIGQNKFETHIRLPKGEYDLKTKHSKDKFHCRTKQVQILSDVEVEMNCTEKFRVIMQIPDSAFTERERNRLKIKVDGQIQQNIPLQAEQGKFQFIIPDLTEGLHEFSIDFGDGTRELCQTSLNVRSDNQRGVFDCPTSFDIDFVTPLNSVGHSQSINNHELKQIWRRINNFELSIDGVKLDQSRYSYKSSDSVFIFTVKGVPAGRRSLSIRFITDARYACDKQFNASLISPTTIRIDCNFNPS